MTKFNNEPEPGELTFYVVGIIVGLIGFVFGFLRYLMYVHNISSAHICFGLFFGALSVLLAGLIISIVIKERKSPHVL